MTRSPESLALALLTNRVVDVGVKPFTAREFFRTFASLHDLDGILELSPDGIATKFLVAPDAAQRIVELLAASRAFAFELERLEESGVHLLTQLDDDFPYRLRTVLGDQCPAALLTAGPVDWLSMPSVGIVGSRSISDSDVEVARRIASVAVEAGFGVTSGLAKGIDQTAMAAGLDFQGRVCGFPSEGVNIVARRSDVRAAVHDDALALASPFGPNAPFSVGNAMARNKLIYGACDVTVVVRSDKDKGGTWAGATEALERGYGRVAVWMGADAGPGNAALVARGATPITDLDDCSWLNPAKTAEPVPVLWPFETPRLF